MGKGRKREGDRTDPLTYKYFISMYKIIIIYYVHYFGSGKNPGKGRE